jgi:hypothetical protein
MANLTSFQADILPLFTERDIHAMRKAFNLGSYDDVKAHAAANYDRIRGIGEAGAASAAKRRRALAAIPNRAIREMDGGWVPTLRKG